MVCPGRVLCVLLQLRHFRQDHWPSGAEPCRRCEAISSLLALSFDNELVDIHQRLGNFLVHYLVHVCFRVRRMVGNTLDGLIRVLFMELLEPSGFSARTEQLRNFRAEAVLPLLRWRLPRLLHHDGELEQLRMGAVLTNCA